MKDRHLALLGLAAGVGVAFAMWNYLSRRNEALMRLRRPAGGSSQRAADRPLTRQEVRIKKQAQRLVIKGRLIQAAQMLEQAGFYRDAIDILENGRFFDDAVRVLLRLQRPGRAGVLYSRNGLFEPAAQCFIQAGDHLNAAKCFREAGKLSEAAELFSKSAQFGDAAACQEKAGRLMEAARSWVKANKLTDALRCWDKVGQDASYSTFKPNNDDLDSILQAIKNGASTAGLIKLAASSTKAGEFILDLLNTGAVETANKIFHQAPQTVSVQLLREINIQSPAANYLVEFFNENSQHKNAAVLLEQLNRFPEAAAAFLKAGDTERANYCANRTKKTLAEATPHSVSATSHDAPSNDGAIPRANFFIETSTQPGIKSSDANIKPGTPAPSLHTPLSSAPVADARHKLSVSSDEERLLLRSWLFAGVNEEDVERLTARFSASEYVGGHKIQSGAANTYLVMLVTGDFTCGQRLSPLDGWLSPEIGLTDQAALEWTVTSPRARVVSISAADLGAILSRDAGLTRQVYVNLTQRFLPQNPKSSILKAI